MIRTSTLLPSLTAVALAVAALAPLPAAAAEASMMNPADIKWGDAPPSLPKGAKMAVIHGDPGKDGPFTVRLRAPGGYRIAPHWHSKDENLTVLSGTFMLGLGDKFDAKQMHALKAGGFHYLPAKTNHYAMTKGTTELQVSGTGPFDVTYLNPADDPSKAP